MFVNGGQSTVDRSFVEFGGDQFFNSEHHSILPSDCHCCPVRWAEPQLEPIRAHAYSPTVLHGLVGVLDLEDATIGRELGR